MNNSAGDVPVRWHNTPACLPGILRTISWHYSEFSLGGLAGKTLFCTAPDLEIRVLTFSPSRKFQEIIQSLEHVWKQLQSHNQAHSFWILNNCTKYNLQPKFSHRENKKLARPTGRTLTMVVKVREAAERHKEHAHMYIMCVCVLRAYVWRACHRQCAVPVWGWGSAQWSTACPLQLHPPLSPWDGHADSDWWLCPALLSPPAISTIPCSCAPLLSGPTCCPWLLMQSLAHH